MIREYNFIYYTYNLNHIIITSYGYVSESLDKLTIEDI